MKIFTTKMLALVTSALLLGACSQMATYENEDLLANQEVAAKNGFNLTPFGTSGNENLAISEAPCITTATADAFGQNYMGTYNSNDIVKIRVYNTLTHIVYVFSEQFNAVKLTNFDGSLITLVNNTYSVPLGSWAHGDTRSLTFWVGRNGPNGQGAGQATTVATSYNLIGICTDTTLSAGTPSDICVGEAFTLTASVAATGIFTGGTIEILAAGNPTPVASAAVTTTVKSVTYSVPTGTVGSFSFSARYVPSGTNGYKASVSSSSIVGVKACDVACEESFSYVENENGTYTFTYIPSADLGNANLSFTFPQSALNGDPLPGWTYNGQTMQTTEDLVACTIYTWTVSLSCKPLNNPQNKWTDFKVGIVSKKGLLENIKCD